MSSKATWQPILGVTRSHFPLVPSEWKGPVQTEALLNDSDDMKGVRALFTKADGTERIAEVRYLARTTKHTFRRPHD